MCFVVPTHQDWNHLEEEMKERAWSSPVSAKSVAFRNAQLADDSGQLLEQDARNIELENALRERSEDPVMYEPPEQGCELLWNNHEARRGADATRIAELAALLVARSAHYKQAKDVLAAQNHGLVLQLTDQKAKLEQAMAYNCDYRANILELGQQLVDQENACDGTAEELRQLQERYAKSSAVITGLELKLAELMKVFDARMKEEKSKTARYAKWLAEQGKCINTSQERMRESNARAQHLDCQLANAQTPNRELVIKDDESCRQLAKAAQQVVILSSQLAEQRAANLFLKDTAEFEVVSKEEGQCSEFEEHFHCSKSDDIHVIEKAKDAHAKLDWVFQA
jgi:hypothetical protein